MPSKNDLSGLKTASRATSILPTKERPQAVPATKTGRVGRPAKEKAAKRSYKITLSLTEEEGQKIAEKSGLAGDATYLYDQLKNNGAFD
ncbi:MAG: hypothetical protein COC24_018795 [Alphaproteobacteria bacterium]|nr:hypothetical protein [Alphaproteobacteria bacterium]